LAADWLRDLDLDLDLILEQWRGLQRALSGGPLAHEGSRA